MKHVIRILILVVDDHCAHLLAQLGIFERARNRAWCQAVCSIGWFFTALHLAGVAGLESFWGAIPSLRLALEVGFVAGQGHDYGGDVDP